MTICDAIRDRRLIQFSYDGHQRVVIPAAYGRHASTGNEVLRGYQVRGTSSTRTPPLWDLFLVTNMVGLTVLDETFVNDPPQYKRGDKHINVVCEL